MTNKAYIQDNVDDGDNDDGDNDDEDDENDN